MKNKLISTLMLIALVCTALAGGVVNPSEVFAGGENKTAELSTVNASLDGKPAVTIQSYKIDGSNYVRAYEVAKLLNIKVINSTTLGKTLLNPEKPYESGSLTKLTEESIKVALTDGSIAYAGNISSMPHFAYYGENFYKLTDIIGASENTLAHERDWVEAHAPRQSYDERYMGTKSIKTYEIDWDGAAAIAEITTVTTDLQAYLREIRSGSRFEIRNTQAVVIPTLEMVQKPNHIDKTIEPVIPQIDPQPEMTAPPAVGSQPANILIDINEGAYNLDGTANTENFTTCYNNKTTFIGDFGQCTWYATARFLETTGANLYRTKLSGIKSYGVNLFLLSDTKADWPNTAKENDFPGFTGITDIKDIQARSIACWDYHVLFVEYVERNADGTPAYVYFTEANTGNDGVYRPDKDAKVQKLSFDEFVSRDPRSPLRGYVVAK